jgi:hypothetical protein
MIDFVKQPGEEFFWIPGYEGRYKLSNQHRVLSVARKGRLMDQILKQCPNATGYLHVNLLKNNEQKITHIHTIMTEMFHGSRPPGQQVRHLNGDQADNSISNLCWGTKKQDNMDKRRNGTCGGRVVVWEGVEYPSIIQAAEATGCNRVRIGCVCRGKLKTTNNQSGHFKNAASTRRWARPVQRDDGTIYESISAAARANDCSMQLVWYACNGKAKQAASHKWRYHKEAPKTIV